MASAVRSRSSSNTDNGQYAYIGDSPDASPGIRHSVQFGRVSGISGERRNYLVAYFNGCLSDTCGEYVDITKRIHQYYTRHEYYVITAIESGRKLTGQEWEVVRNRDAPGSATDVSVAHILGSGLVQNLLNRMILQFRDGEAIFRWDDGAASKSTPLGALRRAQRWCASAQRRIDGIAAADNVVSAAGNDAAKIMEHANENLTQVARPVIHALATQAAAIARLRGIGRAIIAEEPVAHGYGELLTAATDTAIDKRCLMARDVDVVLGNGIPLRATGRARSRGDEGRGRAHSADSAPSDDPQFSARKVERQRAYLSYLRHTVDSPGNLRLGSRRGNTAVGAAFDMPLTDRLEPTERGLRLYESLRTYGLPDMEECATVEACNDTYRTGHFTTDTDGRRLSSSIQVSDAQNDAAMDSIADAML